MCEERIDELVVESDTERVNGVITTAEGDDTGPRKGKAVGLDAILCQQRDIRLPEPVRVRCHVSALSVLRLSGCVGKVVPYRLAPTVYIGGPLNLEGSWKTRETLTEDPAET